MDRQAHVLRGRTHLNRQHTFRDQLACTRAGDADAEDAARLLLEHELGQTVHAVDADRAAARAPRELRNLDVAPLGLRLRFGQTGPGDLGVGEDDGGDRGRLEHRLVPLHRFHRDAGLVRRLVREHRLAGDIADREDGRLRRPALPIGLDEPLGADLHGGRVETRDLRVRHAADRDEDTIEGAIARGLAFEEDANGVLGFRDLRHLRVEHDFREQLLEPLLQQVHEIAIGSGKQAAGHLDDRHLAAERRVHAAELEADVAAADDEERPRHLGQLEGGGGIHHARALERQRRNARRARSGREDAVLEGELGLAALAGNGHRLRTGERRATLDEFHLAHAPDLADAARQLVDDPLLERAQLVDVDPRLVEAHAPRARVA